MAFISLDVVPSSFELTQILNDESFRDASGGFWVAGRGGNRWGLTLTFANLTGANRRVLWANVAALRGQQNHLVVGFGAMGYVRASAYGGTPVVNGVQAAGATSIILDGAAPSIDPYVKAGDLVTFDDELKIITVDTNSDGSGNVSISIWPELHKSVPDNANFNTSNPYGLFKLLNVQGLGAVPAPADGDSGSSWRSPTVVLTLEEDVSI